MPYGQTWKTFGKDLYKEISEDNVSNGAAALAYYLTLALFPALILLLGIVPYLPIDDVDQAIMEMLGQALPAEASKLLSGVVGEVVNTKSGGILSFGALATLWAASAGFVAIMQQLNITYDVTEGRSFIKVRFVAIALTVGVGLLMTVAFSSIVLGGVIQDWLVTSVGFEEPIASLFAVGRWVIIVVALLAAFAFTYYFGPDVEQKFKFVTPGSLLGVGVLVAASLLIRFYVSNFADYSKTYGSIGAVIVLMLWLYVTGLVLLLGSEVNALIEHYHPEGKDKGEKEEPARAA
jgi:membrane protein